MGILGGTRPGDAATLAETRELFRTGQYAQCAELSGQEIEKGSFSQEWRFLKLESEMALGRYADAAVTLTEAKKITSSNMKLMWLERDVRRFNGESAKADEVLADIGARVERSSGTYRDLDTMIVIGKFFLEIGADPKQIRVDVYKQLQKRAPSFVGSYLASAELALSKNDYALAAEDYQKALQVDEDNPEVMYGLARAFESSDSEKAEKYLKQALEINPNHVPSLLLVAENHLLAESYDQTEEVLQQILKVNPHEPRAWAMRAVLAHLANDQDQETFSRAQALKYWTDNPEVDFLIGKYLAQKYRFAEAAEAQRRALAFDSDYLPAKMELSNDLLRLGDEETGWRLAAEVFDRDNYNVVAHNLATLHEHMQKFRTLQSDGFVVRMDAEEAEIYGPRVLALLREAKQVLCEKYDVELNETIAVEIFPKQQDFAIRTFGLPGGAGFLGVCFGNVITMNSPASRGANPSNWEAVLWHEFCHVVTLTKTRNKMPRWLSEGISVYEEGLKNPAWGQSISPAYRQMILGDDLTPVSELSSAFRRPPSSKHLLFAYYESAVVVEFLVEQFGVEALQAILVDLGKGLQINDALARHAAPLDGLDAAFEKYIRARATSFAPEASFAVEELPPFTNSAEWKVWIEQHPNNFLALQQYAMALLREEEWQAAQEPVDKLLQFAPDYAGEGNALRMKAKIHQAQGETEAETEVLEHLADLSSDVLDVYRRLAELHTDQENWQAVVVDAKRILAVNPLTPEPHQLLAQAGERLEDREVAIEGLQTLTRMDPYDPADVHYRVALLLQQTGKLDEARRHVLLALEEAPRYRDAHKLLLSLTQPSDAPLTSDSPAATNPVPEKPAAENAGQDRASSEETKTDDSPSDTPTTDDTPSADGSPDSSASASPSLPDDPE
ncbi:tetratricopeptide repeat protein [Blastopirellula marina]|nr:tetratricopeptide repeat protein [Blastopirellula marina]